MKKLGLYAVLVSALLFTTGCAEKDVNADETGVQSSSASNNTLKSANSSSFTVNGQQVAVENVYFDFDKYNLNTPNQERALSNASKLKQVSSANTIKVYGNTDEWGSDEYNYALGLKRANTVKNVLVKNGVKAKITPISLGESKPVCTEKTEDCWAKNRRVEHELTK